MSFLLSAVDLVPITREAEIFLHGSPGNHTLDSTSMVFSKQCSAPPIHTGGAMISASSPDASLVVALLSTALCTVSPVGNAFLDVSNVLRLGYPPDADFASDNGWPSGWQTPNDAYARLKARLPSTQTPSPDGKLYLTQVYDVVSKMLNARNFQPIVINDNPNSKNYVYGRPAFSAQGGTRYGPMATYFQTAKARSNFHFWQWTYVTGLVRTNGTITGVRTNYTAYGGNGSVDSSQVENCHLRSGFIPQYRAPHDQRSRDSFGWCLRYCSYSLPERYWSLGYDLSRGGQLSIRSKSSPILSIHQPPSW